MDFEEELGRARDEFFDSLINSNSTNESIRHIDRYLSRQVHIMYAKRALYGIDGMNTDHNPDVMMDEKIFNWCIENKVSAAVQVIEELRNMYRKQKYVSPNDVLKALENIEAILCYGEPMLNNNLDRVGKYHPDVVDEGPDDNI